MSTAEKYQAIIIGTGQAGKPLAGALATAGWRTAIIERDRVGGTCVVAGCTPTKTMVASARVAYVARRAGEYGVRTGPISIDMELVRKRKRTVVDDDTDQILGASILALEGGEIATVIQVAMMGRVPYTELKEGVFSHPTLAESLNNLFMAMDA